MTDHPLNLNPAEQDKLREPQLPLSQKEIPNRRPIPESFYESVGGAEVFERIVRDFYSRVVEDDVLWPMYPQHDLEGAIDRLSKFLIQFWGGPGWYSAERGHPRLRMRHFAFKVNPLARDRWLLHMNAAIRAEQLPPIYEESFLDYVDRAARMLVNTFDD